MTARLWLAALALTASGATAQVNVLTAHNDIARTGQNLSETMLTPSNVNSTQFGKLFSQQVNGEIHAQPLYVSQVAVSGKGTHNLVYVATDGDMVYAFDADTNGGIDAGPIWQDSLLTNATPAGALTNANGVLATPVIDLPSKTMYVVSSEYKGTSAIYRLHALDITTGAEKLGGPVLVQATIAGTGSESSAGVLSFDPLDHLQRPGLLLLNGVVYFAFGSNGDEGPWHGWIFSYNDATLQQIDVFCTSADGTGGGIWMGGAGLAAEVNNPAKPYGRMFVTTGNGVFYASPPYNNGMSYAMSVLDLDLTGGAMTIEDDFTPHNWSTLDPQDADLGSGAPVLLPAQTLSSGNTLTPLVQIGKSGTIYILDRNNLGGFNATTDQIPQEVQTPITAGYNWGAGVWGSTAYWNNTIYSGGTNPSSTGQADGSGNSLTAYSLVNGVLSTAPVSKSTQLFAYAGPVPSVSANGTKDGIVWILKTDGLESLGYETLLAYDATNLANTLYSSDDYISRDNAGISLNFIVPTIANGKVYAGSKGEVSIYGLLGDTPATPAPVLSPSSGTYTGTETVTIADSLAGSIIYYTTDGSAPSSASSVYEKPLVISSNETVKAVAGATGYLQSATASATYVSTSTTANPAFSLAAGAYSGSQTLSLSDISGGAVIHYTLDGSTPTASSPVYSKPLAVSVSETVQALALAPGLFASAIVSSSYTINPVYVIDFSQGFALAHGPMQFNGSTELDDFRLQLSNGGLWEANSAFYATPVNVQSFTTDFTFQLSNPEADGITFTIQNVGPSAVGTFGEGLGYASIPKSVAIKFDIHSNAGEGPNSTGLYTEGLVPTLPALNLTGTGIDLHSGDDMNTHITYDGQSLNLTLTDALTLATWSHSFAINIPPAVGGNTAYVGFTGGTGSLSSSQKLNSWTYSNGVSVPSYPAGFDAGGLTLNGGAALNGTRLRLTDGGTHEGRSAFFTSPVNVQQFTTSFEFQLTNAQADGFAFVIQGVGPTALGGQGGGLGYGADPSVPNTPYIPKSVAVKFDLYSNAGEGPDSTGIYTEGQEPTMPSINLSSTGINFHSRDTFNAQLTYNGTALTVVITDMVTNASDTQVYTVNIPAYVSAPTAFIGFTAGSGGKTAIQDILNWTYSGGTAN